MDRLETQFIFTKNIYSYIFTFQYGQIRNLGAGWDIQDIRVFTFQYGQIRNDNNQIQI